VRLRLAPGPPASSVEIPEDKKLTGVPDLLVRLSDQTLGTTRSKRPNLNAA